MARSHNIVEAEERSFRKMLIDISESIRTDELEKLKFYCTEYVPTARREDINIALQLWEALMENGRMSSSDTAFLQELMDKAIQRNDLLDVVIQYTNCVHVPQQTVLMDEFKFIAERVNLRKWRHLVRTLGITDADIERLAEQYRTNVCEQVLQALLLWARRAGTQASRAVLIDALCNCQLRSLAESLPEPH